MTHQQAAARILIAGEDEAGARLLTAYLLSAGYDVVAANDPADVAQRTARESFDLLLVSCSPERLEPLGAPEGVATLLVCSDSADDRVYGRELGADDLIVEPFTRSELLLRVGSLLRLAALRDELDAARSELERVRASGVS